MCSLLDVRNIRSTPYFSFFQRRTAETSTLTATWWSRPAFACTTTTRRRAVRRALESPTDSPFSVAADSPLCPMLGRTLYPLQVPGSARGEDQLDLGLNGQIIWLPKAETEQGTFLLVHSEAAVGKKGIPKCSGGQETTHWISRAPEISSRGACKKTTMDFNHSLL